MKPGTDPEVSPDADSPEGWGAFEEPEGWRTGTVADEFTPLYLALGRATKLHGPLAPSEVDAMDLTTVAALLGVGGEHSYEAELEELNRRGAAGERVTWS